MTKREQITEAEEQLSRECEFVARAPASWWLGPDWDAEDGGETTPVIQNFDDINYILGQGGALLGVRMLVADGGPTIWVDTQINQVQGTWWSYELKFDLPPDVGEAINETIKDTHTFSIA